jgi:tetratricopeptide (TPR) repeat protein
VREQPHTRAAEDGGKGRKSAADLWMSHTNLTREQGISYCLFSEKEKAAILRRWLFHILHRFAARTILLVFVLAIVNVQGCNEHRRRLNPFSTVEVQACATELCLRGQAKLSADEYKEAIELLSSFLLQEPENNWAYNELGQLYLDAYCYTRVLGSTDRACNKGRKLAKRVFEKSHGLDETDAQAILGLAQVHEDIDPQKALEYYKKALAIRPDDISIMTRIGKCLFRLKKYSESLDVLERATSSTYDKRPEIQIRMAHEWLGRVYIAMGEYAKAEKSLVLAAKDLRQIKSGEGAYWGCPYEALGELYLYLGKVDTMQKSFATAADISPKNPIAQFEAATGAFRAGDYNTAILYADRGLALEKLQELLAVKGYCLIMTRRYDEARVIFSDLTENDDLRIAAFVGLGHISLAQKKNGDAESYFAKALKQVEFPERRSPGRQDPTRDFGRLVYRLAYIGQAWLLANQGHYQEALPYYDQILKTTPSHVLTLVSKGNALAWLGRIDEAEICYQRVLTIQPKNAYALAELGLLHYNRGHDREAEQLFHEALKQDNQHYTCPYEGLGLLYLRQGKITEAKQNFEQSISINPNIEYKKFNGLAEIYIKEGRFDEAEKLLRKSIENYTRNEDAQQLLDQLTTMRNSRLAGFPGN